MQVYSVLRLLTARPGDDELAGADHRLFGHVHPARPWSVADWLADVGVVLADLAAAGRPAIVTGGTGLYFSALEAGLSQMPAPDPEIREKWRAVAARSPQTLHGELASRDPQGASALRPGDTQRLVRALEIFDSTGLPLWRHQAEGRREGLLRGYEVERFVLDPPRSVLHERIDRRFEAMVEAGAVAEVEALLALELDSAMPAMKAIGVPQISAYLRGQTTLAEAIDRAQAATRQYAKRQSTWFRGQFPAEWLRVVEKRQIVEKMHC
jgi:tRNA dimethylallyltransferase